MFSDIQPDHLFHIFQKCFLESVHTNYVLNNLVHSAKPLLCKTRIFKQVYFYFYFTVTITINSFGSLCVLVKYFLPLCLCFWFLIFASMYRLTSLFY